MQTMTNREKVAALQSILEGCESTAQFLQLVQSSIERLYCDETETCSEGFAGLDTAIAAFESFEEERR